MSTLASADVTVIGSGLSASATAIALIDRLPPDRSLALVGPSAARSRGVAYGTGELCHLLNVPAGRMSLFEDRPGHFVDWLAARGMPYGADDFVPRRLYGDYVDATLSGAARRAGNRTALTQVDATADDLVRCDEGGLAFALSDGSVLRAGSAVLCLGAAAARLPVPADRIDPAAAPTIVEDVWSDWSAALDRDAPVVLVGTGLTMVDQVLLLASRGHRGPIHAVSRRGLLPQPHRFPRAAPVEPLLTAALLSGKLKAFREAAASVEDWRAVVDGIRARTPALWQDLGEADRARFLRHLMPFWTVHRHRTAPDAARTLALLKAEGQLHVHAGRVTAVEAAPGGRAAVRFRPRGAAFDRVLTAAAVLTCCGTERASTEAVPLLKRLAAAGVVTADPSGLGIAVDGSSRAIAADGTPVRSLFAIGATTQGRFLESTAVPEIRRQAADVAASITQRPAA